MRKSRLSKAKQSRLIEYFVADTGFKIMVRMLVKCTLADNGKDTWAQVIYPHRRGKNPVLRIDEEPYEYSPKRKFCTDIPLPGLDIGKECGNVELEREIAKTVLKFLPVSEELCFR